MPEPVKVAATHASISGFFGAFLSNPFPMATLTIESGLESGKVTWKLLIPGVVAASVGYVIFFSITGSVFGGLYKFPSYEGLQIIQLAHAVVLGLVGGLLGLLFIYVFKALKRAINTLRSRPI